MPKAIRIHANGGPELMRWEDFELPPPGAGGRACATPRSASTIRTSTSAAADFYLARPLRFPLILGNEAAGVVESVGPGVTEVAPGDRVAYPGMRGELFEETGAYAQARNVPAERLIKLPDGLSDRQAAAMMVKGFTTSLIINRIFLPKPGDAVLIHAAASGVKAYCANGRSTSAPPSSAPSARPRRQSSRRRTAATAVLYREVDFVDAVRELAPAAWRRCSTASARTPLRRVALLLRAARSACW